MSKETTSLLIAGVLFLAPAAGCKTAPRQESGLADEMATNMTYGGPPRAARPGCSSLPGVAGFSDSPPPAA